MLAGPEELAAKLKEMSLPAARVEFSKIVDEFKDADDDAEGKAILQRNALLATALREAEVNLWKE